MTSRSRQAAYSDTKKISPNREPTPATAMNKHLFSDIINDWRQDYNKSCPHSSLNFLTPVEFAAGWRYGGLEGKQTDMTNLLLVTGHNTCQ